MIPRRTYRVRVPGIDSKHAFATSSWPLALAVRFPDLASAVEAAKLVVGALSPRPWVPPGTAPLNDRIVCAVEHIMGSEWLSFVRRFSADVTETRDERRTSRVEVAGLVYERAYTEPVSTTVRVDFDTPCVEVEAHGWHPEGDLLADSEMLGEHDPELTVPDGFAAE